MTPKQPPAIAAWMLRHFGSGPNNEALLGDLAEQYRQNDNALAPELSFPLACN
jgi:hypothetical protein